jgi:hypothetical protein
LKTAKDCGFGHNTFPDKEAFGAVLAKLPWFQEKMKEHEQTKKAAAFEKKKAKGKGRDNDGVQSDGDGRGRDKDKKKKGKGKGASREGSREPSPAGRDKSAPKQNKDYRASGRKAFAYFTKPENCHEATVENICADGDDCQKEACRGKRCHFNKDDTAEVMAKGAAARKAAAAVPPEPGADDGDGANKKKNNRKKK